MQLVVAPVIINIIFIYATIIAGTFETIPFHWTSLLSITTQRVITVSVMCKLHTTFQMVTVYVDFVQHFNSAFLNLFNHLLSPQTPVDRVFYTHEVNVCDHNWSTYLVFFVLVFILLLCPNQLSRWIQYPL